MMLRQSVDLETMEIVLEPVARDVGQTSLRMMNVAIRDSAKGVTSLMGEAACSLVASLESVGTLMPKLEIKVNGCWLEVTEFIFKSWGGERRKDGIAYVGTVVYLGIE